MLVLSRPAEWDRNMRATSFELRFPTLTRLLLVGAAVCSYFLDRDDVVWRFIRDLPSRRPIEHACFFLAALLIGLGAVLCTHSRASSRRHSAEHRIGELLYAVGLASLLPLAGAVFLVLAESLRLLRLGSAEAREAVEASGRLPFTDFACRRPALGPPQESAAGRPRWGAAVRLEADRWGLFLTMIAFSLTLIDRLADVLAVASILVWLLVNAAMLCRAQTPTEAARS